MLFPVLSDAVKQKLYKAFLIFVAVCLSVLVIYVVYNLILTFYTDKSAVSKAEKQVQVATVSADIAIRSVESADRNIEIVRVFVDKEVSEAHAIGASKVRGLSANSVVLLFNSRIDLERSFDRVESCKCKAVVSGDSAE